MKSIAARYARELIDLAADLGPDEAAKAAKRFAELLTERRQTGLLPEIITALEAAPESGSTEVMMTAAAEVPKETADALRNGLQKKIGAPVSLTVETDADLVGGAVIRYGDTRFDGSLRGRLETLKQRLSQ